MHYCTEFKPKINTTGQKPNLEIGTFTPIPVNNDAKSPQPIRMLHLIIQSWSQSWKSWYNNV